MRVSTVYTLGQHVIIVMHDEDIIFHSLFELLPYFIEFKLNPLLVRLLFCRLKLTEDDYVG